MVHGFDRKSFLAQPVKNLGDFMALNSGTKDKYNASGSRFCEESILSPRNSQITNGSIKNICRIRLHNVDHSPHTLHGCSVIHFLHLDEAC